MASRHSTPAVAAATADVTPAATTPALTHRSTIHAAPAAAAAPARHTAHSKAVRLPLRRASCAKSCRRASRQWSREGMRRWGGGNRRATREWGQSDRERVCRCASPACQHRTRPWSPRQPSFGPCGGGGELRAAATAPAGRVPALLSRDVACTATRLLASVAWTGRRGPRKSRAWVWQPQGPWHWAHRKGPPCAGDACTESTGLACSVEASSPCAVRTRVSEGVSQSS